MYIVGAFRVSEIQDSTLNYTIFKTQDSELNRTNFNTEVSSLNHTIFNSQDSSLNYNIAIVPYVSIRKNNKSCFSARLEYNFQENESFVF